MANTTTLINGDAHDWSQVDINILGRTVEGVTAISYSSEQDKANNYGRGNKPVSRGRGKKQYTGSITLSEAEINAIENALPPGKDIMDIRPFPIIVSFNRNGVYTVHRLEACEFMGRGVEMNNDTNDVEYQIGLIIGDIKYNA